VKTHKYQQEIYNFIQNYYNDISTISEFNIDFFLKNKIHTIDLDMSELKDFIFQAFSFLRNNSGLFFSQFINKLYKDIKNLCDYREEFVKKSKLTNNIFENEFLKTLSEYQILLNKVNENKIKLKKYSTSIASIETEMKFFTPKTKEDETYLKKLKGKLVDAIHYQSKAKDEIQIYSLELREIHKSLKEIFITEFNKVKNSYMIKLDLVINTKLYYLNKQMWIEANQSQKTLTYLKDLGINKINLHIYINRLLAKLI